MKRVVVIAAGIALGLSLAASAQENRSEFSLQGAGLFASSDDRKWNGLQRHRKWRHLGHLSLPSESLDLRRRRLTASASTRKNIRCLPSRFAFSLASINSPGAFVFNLVSRPHWRVNAVFPHGRRSRAVRAHRRSIQFAFQCANAGEGRILCTAWE